MADNQLVIAFPEKSVAKIKNIFSGSESVRWAYLGDDFLKKRKIKKILGDRYELIDIARLLDEVAKDIKFKHVEWIEKLNKRYGKDLGWWFGSVSTRNIYSSKLFQYCCYLEILKKLWQDPCGKPALVFVESKGLSKSILRWMSNQNVDVKVVCHFQAKLKLFSKALFPVLRWGKFVTVVFLRWLAALLTRIQHKPKRINKDSPVILATTVHESSLSKQGVFKDRYFPYLHEFVEKKKLPTLIYPFFYGFRFSYFSIYKRMRICSDCFIMQEDFLKFSDYCAAILYPLRALRLKIHAEPFHGFDLSDVLQEEQREESVISGLEPTLIYRLFYRLKNSGLNPASLITWYENRVGDRALVAGARQAFPGLGIVGAQIFLHAPNYLSLCPSPSEVEAGLTPDFLIETSQHQCWITKSFAEHVVCQPGAALRYAHVFNESGSDSKDHNQSVKTIIVLLPFNMSGAVELLESMREALDQIGAGVRVWVKGHPDYDTDAVVRLFGKNWPSRFEIMPMNLSQALKQASVVVSSTSSAMVEAVVNGIPAIFMAGQMTLNQNILFDLKMDITAECFSVPELVAMINKYLNLSEDKMNEYQAMGKKVRDLYFEPVNDETLQPFLRGIGTH